MIYILCAAVIVAAVPLSWWLKRDAERSWQRHQALARAARQREQMARLTKSFAQVRITLIDNMTPALQRAGRAVQELAAAFDREPS